MLNHLMPSLEPPTLAKHSIALSGTLEKRRNHFFDPFTLPKHLISTTYPRILQVIQPPKVPFSIFILTLPVKVL